MIHHLKLDCPPLFDYRRPPDGRHVIPWSMHPKARTARRAAFQPVDLTPFVPCVYNQSRIGECSACGSIGAAQTSLAKAGKQIGRAHV